MMLRHGRIYPGKKSWGARHRRWLAEQTLGLRASDIALGEALQAVRDAETRQARTEAAIEAMLQDWSLAPVVAGPAGAAWDRPDLGGDADGGARRPRAVREPSPAYGICWARPVGAFDRRQGQARRHHQTRQCGRAAHTRRSVLGLSACATHRACETLRPRSASQAGHRHSLESAEPPVRAVSQAQRRGKRSTIAAVAVARELAAFVWAIGREVPIAA